ncbi:hypothetical protein [Jannaschia marina]|uniref:hypothetical protein n=1 Tax=Jannaschia marina TaxID=2741674 RepID=UPI0015CB9B36|nr:hypothetical protein [Jannaschia marina]
MAGLDPAISHFRSGDAVWQGGRVKPDDDRRKERTPALSPHTDHRRRLDQPGDDQNLHRGKVPAGDAAVDLVLSLPRVVFALVAHKSYQLRDAQGLIHPADEIVAPEHLFVRPADLAANAKRTVLRRDPVRAGLGQSPAVGPYRCYIPRFLPDLPGAQKALKVGVVKVCSMAGMPSNLSLMNLPTSSPSGT